MSIRVLIADDQALVRSGFRLIVDATTPLMAAHKALRQCYAALAKGEPDPLLGSEPGKEQEIVHQTIKLDHMLAVERATVQTTRPSIGEILSNVWPLTAGTHLPPIKLS